MGSDSGSQGSGSGSGSGSAVPADKPVPHIVYGPNAEQLKKGKELKKQLEDEANERARKWKASYDAIPNAAKKAVIETQKHLDALDPSIGKQIESLAMSYWQGSQATRRSPWYEPGVNTCNILVFDVIFESGAPAPLVMHLYRTNPIKPLTEHWGNPNFKIDHWEVVTNPRPGDVASNGHHMAVVITGNETIWQSSTTHLIEKGDWGFNPINHPDQGTVVFRRYVP